MSARILGRFLSELARGLERTGRLGEAEAAYREALELSEDDPAG